MLDFFAHAGYSEDDVTGDRTGGNGFPPAGVWCKGQIGPRGVKAVSLAHRHEVRGFGARTRGESGPLVHVCGEIGPWVRRHGGSGSLAHRLGDVSLTGGSAVPFLFLTSRVSYICYYAIKQCYINQKLAIYRPMPRLCIACLLVLYTPTCTSIRQ